MKVTQEVKRLCDSCKKKEYCPLPKLDNLQGCSYYKQDESISPEEKTKNTKG